VVRELFRFVRGETPTLDDFQSQGARGKQMRFNRHDSDAVRRWNAGVSVYDDFEHASRLAADAGFEWIATLTLRVPTSYEVSQYGRDPRHYTIFGDPEELMALVSEVHHVSWPLGD